MNSNQIATEVKGNKQARRWCFTWNNPPQDDVVIKNFILGCNCSYYVIGFEVGASGTPHLQGYMEFSTPKRFETLKKVRNEVHWIVCNGDQKSNYTYCTKDGRFLEGGTPTAQGERNDLTEMRDIIHKGGSMLDCAETNFGSFVRYHRGFEKYQYLINQQRIAHWRDVKIAYLWGDTGTGKTRKVREVAPFAFCPMDSNTGIWWTGYMNEPDILFDDFRGTVPLHTMLKWLDGYPVQVPIHGGAVYLQANRIYITSNVAPTELYKNCDQRSRDAFIRRISCITYFENGATEVTGNTIPSPSLNSFSPCDENALRD